MATSIEKVTDLVDRVEEMPDSELTAALPFVPAGLTRLAIDFFRSQIPPTAQELDELLDRISSFCLEHHSDPLELTS